MARGDGKQAKQAIGSGKLSAFVDQDDPMELGDKYMRKADWGEIEGRLIAGAVVSVNQEGGSLLFGHTRDGFSYSIMVFYGTAKKAYYFEGNDAGIQACTTFLYGLIEVGQGG